MGVPERHAPGYRRVAELGERLAAAGGLDAQVRRAVADWREVAAAQEALADEVRALPGRVAAWRARGADLPQDGPGGLDPDRPARRAWREEGGTLEAMARDMLRPEDVHAPWLDAVAGAREAIRQAAEQAAETIRSTAAIEALDRLKQEWRAHISEARTTQVHPFYLPAHEDYIDRLQRLRDDPAVQRLPSAELEQMDSLIARDERQIQAVFRIQQYLADVDHCQVHLEQLHDIAHLQEIPLNQVDSFDDWHDTTEELLDFGYSIVEDKGSYELCLDHVPNAWQRVHASIDELNAALGQEDLSFQCQHFHLYLEPITRPVPTSEAAAKADAAYRRLRTQWHDHLARAEEAETHPYHLEGHAALIDAMHDLCDRPGLAANGQEALDALLDDHALTLEAREEIDTYIDEADVSLVRHHHLQELVERSSSPGRRIEDIGTYKEWRDHALRLADAGMTMLADPDRYGIHFKRRPDLAEHVRANVEQLNAALGRDEAAIRPELRQVMSEVEKIAQRHSRSHRMKM